MYMYTVHVVNVMADVQACGQVYCNFIANFDIFWRCNSFQFGFQILNCNILGACCLQLKVVAAPPFNPFTPKSDLIDVSLSNARRFHLSKGDPLGMKGLENYPP